MGDTSRGKSSNTDQNRLGNETLADAALTWQMGNEIVGSLCCVPLSVHPSNHLQIFFSCSIKSSKLPEAVRSVLVGQHPVFPQEWESLTQPKPGNAADRSSSACCTQRSTEGLSYAGQPCLTSLLVYALSNFLILVTGGKHGCLSPGAAC